MRAAFDLIAWWTGAILLVLVAVTVAGIFLGALADYLAPDQEEP